MRVHSIMQKKDNKPPAGVGESAATRKRHEKNKIPDYENLFAGGSGGKGDSGFMMRVFRKDRWRLLYSTLLNLLQSLPVWVMPLITSDVIDTVTTRPDGFVLRLVIDALLFAVVLVQNIPSTMWRSRVMNTMIRNTTAGIRSSVIRKLQRLSITYHREMESGKIQSKLLRDIDNVDNYYRNVVQVVIPAVMSVAVSTGISLYSSLIVTLFFVAIVPLNVLLAVLFRKRIRRKNRDFRKENEQMSGKMTTMLQMLTLTKAHGLEQEEERSMNTGIQNVTQAGLRLDRTNAAFGASAWVMGNLLSGVCLFFCVFLAIKGCISLGEIVLFQSMFGSINGNVLTLVNCFPALATGRESVRSLSEIMRAEDMEGAGGGKEIEVVGNVDFDCVSYRYPDGDKDVIKNLDLHVNAGECIAFVGSSGSGKSTVINLIIGLLDPTQGCVRIDGTPLTEMSRAAFRRHLSVVPQNSILFSGSIRENITYGLSHYSEEDLLNAVANADIPEFLPLLPNGLDTQVGEHGDKLSGGQKQRICIARALIRRPKILIMDEATSALDNVAEYHVQKAIEKMSKQGTTFIVAHRLSTIRHADRIVVMENGEAVEIGTFDELMALGGKFAELEKLSHVHEEDAA